MKKENKTNYEERESQSMDIVEATPEEFDEVLQEMSGTSTTKIKNENEFSYIGDPVDEKNTYVFEEINAIVYHIKKKIEIKIYKDRRNCNLKTQ